MDKSRPKGQFAVYTSELPEQLSSDAKPPASTLPWLVVFWFFLDRWALLLFSVTSAMFSQASTCRICTHTYSYRDTLILPLVLCFFCSPPTCPLPVLGWCVSHPAWSIPVFSFCCVTSCPEHPSFFPSVVSHPVWNIPSSFLLLHHILSRASLIPSFYWGARVARWVTPWSTGHTQLWHGWQWRLLLLLWLLDCVLQEQNLTPLLCLCWVYVLQSHRMITKEEFFKVSNLWFLH